jgi:hypothetical protein
MKANYCSATVFCLGAILAVASDSIIHLIPEIVSGLIKLIRTSQLDVGIRAIAFDSLRKAFMKQLRIDESLIKDLYKVVKFGLVDKSLVIQLRAVQVLIDLPNYLIPTASRSHVSSNPPRCIASGYGKYKDATRPKYGYIFKASPNCSRADFG